MCFYFDLPATHDFYSICPTGNWSHLFWSVPALSSSEDPCGRCIESPLLFLFKLMILPCQWSWRYTERQTENVERNILVKIFIVTPID